MLRLRRTRLRFLALFLCLSLLFPAFAAFETTTAPSASAGSAGVNASACSYANGYCLIQWCVTNASGTLTATIQVYGYRTDLGYYTYRSYSKSFAAGGCGGSTYGEQSWYVGPNERMDTVTITVDNPGYASPTGINLYINW